MGTSDSVFKSYVRLPVSLHLYLFLSLSPVTGWPCSCHTACHALEVCLPPPHSTPYSPLSGCSSCLSRERAGFGLPQATFRVQPRARGKPLFGWHWARTRISDSNRVWTNSSHSLCYVIYMGVKRLNPDTLPLPLERLSTGEQYFMLASLWWEMTLQFHRTAGGIRKKWCEAYACIHVCTCTHKPRIKTASTYVRVYI